MISENCRLLLETDVRTALLATVLMTELRIFVANIYSTSIFSSDPDSNEKL